MDLSVFFAVPGSWKRIFCGCLAVAAATSCLVADQPDAIRVEGNWRPVKAELGGQPMTADVLKTISLRLHKGKYDVLVAGQPDRGTYTLDSSTKPGSMTITGMEGPNTGKTFPAIYEVSGETLRICYDLSGKQRPAEFKTMPGTQLYLVTYHRQKE